MEIYRVLINHEENQGTDNTLPGEGRHLLHFHHCQNTEINPAADCKI